MLEAVAAAAGLPARGGAPRRDLRGRHRAGGARRRSPAARARWRASPSASCSRCCRCSRSRPRTSAAALAQLGTALLEWKLDGARVQVHKSGDEVRVYTRSLNDVTARGARGRRRPCGHRRAQALILDGEAIALRAGRPAASVPGHDAPLRPQARRRGDARRAAAVGVLLRLPATATATPLVDRPARERHDALRGGACRERGHAVAHHRGRGGRRKRFYDDALAQRARRRHGEGARTRPTKPGGAAPAGSR